MIPKKEKIEAEELVKERLHLAKWELTRQFRVGPTNQRL
jgi:hypothetical protein